MSTRQFYSKGSHKHTPLTSYSFWEHPDFTDRRRLERYSKNWDYYHGKHWIKESRDNDDPLMTLNFIKFFIDHHISWLLDKGIVHSPIKGTEHQLIPILKDVWEANGGGQLMRQMLLTGCVTGDLIAMVHVEEPTAVQKSLNPKHPGNIRITHYDSSFVSIDYTTIGTSRMEMEKAVIRQYYYDWSNTATRDEKPDVKIMKQIITKDAIEIYDGNGKLIESKENILGEIPVIHGPNILASGDSWGVSDVDAILLLQKAINESATDIQDIMNYDACPVTVITGAKASDVTRAPGKVWSNLPEKAKVEYLVLPDNLEKHQKWFQLLLDSMFLFARASKKGILGEATSIRGVGLESLWKANIQGANSKSATYGRSFGKIDYFVLRYAQMLNLITEPPNGLCSVCGGKVYAFGNGTQLKCLEVDKDSLIYELLPAKKSNIKREWDSISEFFTQPIPAGEGLPDTPNPAKAAVALIKEPETVEVSNGAAKMDVVVLECNGHRVQTEPFNVEVEFVTGLPRDRTTEFELMNQAQANGWIDHTYARKKLKIEVPEDSMRLRVLRDRTIFGLLNAAVGGNSLFSDVASPTEKGGTSTSTGTAEKSADRKSSKAETEST